MLDKRALRPFENLKSALIVGLNTEVGRFVYYSSQIPPTMVFRLQKTKNFFFNLKSNSALLSTKGHNLLTSAFPQKNVKLVKFPLKKLNISLLKEFFPHIKTIQ